MVVKSSRPSLIFFLIACLTALILLAAAALKWFYSPARDPLFYEIVGVLEAILAFAVLFYWKSWRVWVFLVLIISIWMGFSFYATFFGLPCSCMGGSLSLPRGMSFSLNGLMLFGAWRVLKQHPAHPVGFKRLFWFFGLFFILGFTSAVVYYNYQT
jgi:hypothetical protein